MRHNRRYQRRASSDRTPIAREDSRNFNQYSRRGDIGKGGKRDHLAVYEHHFNQSDPPSSSSPPPPPFPSCEFVSVGGSFYSTFPGNGAYITYDPVNNSSSNILLKSSLDLETMLTAGIVNQAPHYHTGQCYGFYGTNSKWGNIVTAFFRMFMAPPHGLYVKLEVDTAINDIFFHSYYVPDPVNPPQSISGGNVPWGACAKSQYVDIVDSSPQAGGTTPLGTDIYEVTCNPVTSTFTDTLLFNLGPDIAMAGDMVYRSSDNTIFAIVTNFIAPAGTPTSGIRHYHYNGTLIDELWDWNVGGYTMYCHNGEVYFLSAQEKLYRLDENPLSFTLIANPTTYNYYNPATVGDGATDSECCNPGFPPNTCLSPTNPFNQMPYGWRDNWYHDPNDPNMNFSGTLIQPGPWPIQTPPIPPGTPWIAPGTIYNLSQLNSLINTNSTMGPWTHPTTNVSYPSRVLMRNGTVNFDNENQSSICEWCVDWISNGSVPGPGPNQFNPQVLNWPLWIANNWGLAEAEAMCLCCPATDPGVAAWPFPPEINSVIPANQPNSFLEWHWL